jgi:hypothetical protein
MTPDKQTPETKNLDQKTDGSISRRAVGKKALYVAPAILAVIATADRPALAASLPH